ncbi:alkaline phosphatase [Myxococcota bacterium]|nr:alkaline phosphatase [Myxococcota bacterium]
MSTPVAHHRRPWPFAVLAFGALSTACQPIGRSPDSPADDVRRAPIPGDASDARDGPRDGPRDDPEDAALRPPPATDGHTPRPPMDGGPPGDVSDAHGRPVDAVTPDAMRPLADALAPEMGPRGDARVDAAPMTSSDAGADAAADALPSPDAGLRPALPDFGDRDLVGPPPARPRSVILMIGDGMGPGHIEAARAFAGRPLRMETAFPFHGRLTTASLDGVTDSAAAATAMGSGVVTTNHFVGLDRHGVPLESAVALAHRAGARAGLVTTASLPHATPAGFGAHARSRYDYAGLAASMVQTQPEVMLGGGRMWFLPAGAGSGRADAGLLDHLEALGYLRVEDRDALVGAAPDAHGRLVGLFAPDLMQYVADRPPDTAEPTLAEMTTAALRFLEAAPGGFFLMVEGAKIDLAAHANQLQRVVPEVLAFDEAVGIVAEWAAERPEVTILVTADHETGELAVTGDRGPGVLPEVTWGRGTHSNQSVDVFGRGDAAAVFDGEVRGNRWIHAAITAGLTGAPPVPPPPALVPDGRFDDLFPVAAQRRATNFGAGLNQLDGLFVGADPDGMGLGLAGLFERDRNAVVLLIDADYGAGTGLAGLAGRVRDLTGRADALLARLPWDAPPDPGLGFDRAFVSTLGLDLTRASRSADAGLRDLTNADALTALGAPVVFADDVRPDGAPRPPRPAAGLETLLTWGDVYGAQGFPRGARLAVFATLCTEDGALPSNQVLPALPPDAPEPDGNPQAVPGIVILNLDEDLDGEPDPAPRVEVVLFAPPPGGPP